MLQLILFPIMWILVIYVAYVVVRRTFKLPDAKLAVLYISFLAMLGPIGEVFVGSFYEALFNQPLWQYQLSPIHNGYTSYYAPVIWGFSGFYLYMTHEVFNLIRAKSKHLKAAGLSLETIIGEAAINLSFIALTGGFLFYYTPGDLFHVTSLQTLPFYFALGYVIQATIPRIRHNRSYFSAMFLLMMFVLVFLTN